MGLLTKCTSSIQNFPLGFVCALGAGMLEKLDLLQGDQNGNEDTVSRYIAVENGSEHFAENYFLLAVPSSYLGTRGYPGKRRQDHLVAGLVAFGYHHHISIYHDIIKNELPGHFAKSLRNAFMFLVLQIPAFRVPGFTDSGFSCSWFYRFRLFVFLVLQIPAFRVPGFTDSGFSCSWFYRFRLFVFLVLQILAFRVPGFTDSGFSCSWFSRSSFRSPISRSLFYR